MGAWGHGTFENDDASDWIYQLESSPDRALLTSTLRAAAEPSDYLEAPTCSEALAAAEVVAALGGKAHPELPAEAVAWVSAHSNAPASDLRALATAAINRIVADSELKDLWAESEEAGAWLASVNELKARLG